jgi:KRAB domain-containing zinc finger protein
VHLKRRPRERKCPHCDQKVPGHLRAYHLEEMHGIPAPKCGICEKRFRFPYYVLQHHKKVHMGERMVTCDVCDKSFFDNVTLKSHMLTHSQARKFQCDFCRREFRWKNNLKDHILIHMGEKRYLCKLCGKAYAQKSSLKKHAMRNHH